MSDEASKIMVDISNVTDTYPGIGFLPFRQLPTQGECVQVGGNEYLVSRVIHIPHCEDEPFEARIEVVPCGVKKKRE